MDMPAEKINRLSALGPIPHRWTSRMLTRSIFIEPRSIGRDVDHQIEWLPALKSRQRALNLVLGIFPGRLKWRDVAVSKARPVSRAVGRLQSTQLPVKIDEPIPGAKRARFLARL